MWSDAIKLPLGAPCLYIDNIVYLLPLIEAVTHNAKSHVPLHSILSNISDYILRWSLRRQRKKNDDFAHAEPVLMIRPLGLID